MSEDSKMRPVKPRERRRIISELHGDTPHFIGALIADTRAVRRAAGGEGEHSGLRSLLDAVVLSFTTDGFAAQSIYRLRARLLQLRVPVAPRFLHFLSTVWGRVLIGDPVVIAPGLDLTHGRVVIDGLIRIGPGARIGPFVTIGLRAGNVHGPKLGEGVQVDSGARVLGDIEVGAWAHVAPNAVVVRDVPAGLIAAGVPARPLAAEEFMRSGGR